MKRTLKLTIYIFMSIAIFFGLATSFIYKKDSKNINANLKSLTNENIKSKTNDLKSFKDDVLNEETYIKGSQTSMYSTVIWAYHFDKSGKEKDSFYLKDITKNHTEINYFNTEEGNQGYRKIDLSSLLSDGEVIQNFSFAEYEWYNEEMKSESRASIAFWTKTSDNKYHVYTAGYSRGQLGRNEEEHKEEYKTFKKIKNPSSKKLNDEYAFDEIKELSLTYSTLTIWTKDNKNNDHLYFSGTNYGQFGDGDAEDSKYKLKETTNTIRSAIKNEKIKDIAFDFDETGFILTKENKLYAAGRNNDGEIGVSGEGINVTTYQELDTSNIGNIKQMFVSYDYSLPQFGSNYVSRAETLLLVTEDNKLWGLGNNNKHKEGGNKLGIKDETSNILTKLTKIPLEIPSTENILYATTVGSRFSDYSLLITENNNDNNMPKYKIYMAGYGDNVGPNVDDSNEWKYNKIYTEKIFGTNDSSGYNVDLDSIKNLGNSRYTIPIVLAPTTISWTGIIKENKKQHQQEYMFIGNDNKWEKSKWKTKAIKWPKKPTINHQYFLKIGLPIIIVFLLATTIVGYYLSKKTKFLKRLNSYRRRRY